MKRSDYPEVTDLDLARWTAQVDKALRTTNELEALLEKIRRNLKDG